jgi:hypothetical protein
VIPSTGGGARRVPTATLAGMNAILSWRPLVVLSIVYGVTLALLGAFDGPVGPVAIVGALLIGLLWAVYGVLHSRNG